MPDVFVDAGQNTGWEGVPWYLRSGKYLPETATEVIVQLRPPPQRLFADSAPAAGRGNYLRFRLSPSCGVALAARVKGAVQEFAAEQRELYLIDERPVDLPRFGGRVVESIYSGVLMLLLRLALGFSVPGFLSLGTSNAVCRVSGRSFAVC